LIVGEQTHRRTFVASDAHGYPALIQNALDHGGFRAGVDGFVYAGDLLDRGPDPEGCLELVECYVTEVLLGNHELAVLLDFAMCGQDSWSRRFRQFLLDKVLSTDQADAWKVAACVGGVLITHGGLSSGYEALLGDDLEKTPARLAERLNRQFLAAVRQELQTGEWDPNGILGDHGPLWFRPRPYSDLLPLAGIKQVVGHTPPLPELAALDFHMTDPCAFLGMRDAGRYRYAVIEGGAVRVEDGSLGEVVARPRPRTERRTEAVWR
jgi:hypothetical protein